VRAFEAQHALRREAARSDAPVASDDAPVVQVVHMLITQALRDRASDVHIEPQAERVRVRYRIDGALHDVLDLPAAMGPGVASRIKILAGMNIVERRRAQDGQISMDVEGREVDIRVATTATIEGEKVVFSWVIWPDKATCDASHDKMMTDPRMKEFGEGMPFDGKRMVFGGFEPLVVKGR